MLCGLCYGQSEDAAPCADPKESALKHLAHGFAGDLGVAERYCAGSGYALHAEEIFDRGNVSEASRQIANAIRLLEVEPANARLLLGALRIQATMHLERGMLSQAAAVIERLTNMPAEVPEHTAILHGLAGAVHQSAGDAGPAEREYRLAIAQWDSIRRGFESVSERSNLGVLYLSSGRYKDAIAVLERAIGLLAGPGKSSLYHRIVVANNLAVAYKKQGNAVDALRYARESVRLVEAVRSGRSALEANVYSNCAAILRVAGHTKEASNVEYRARRAAALANAVVDVSDLH